MGELDLMLRSLFVPLWLALLLGLVLEARQIRLKNYHLQAHALGERFTTRQLSVQFYVAVMAVLFVTLFVVVRDVWLRPEAYSSTGYQDCVELLLDGFSLYNIALTLLNQYHHDLLCEGMATEAV